MPSPETRAKSRRLQNKRRLDYAQMSASGQDDSVSEASGSTTNGRTTSQVVEATISPTATFLQPSRAFVRSNVEFNMTSFKNSFKIRVLQRVPKAARIIISKELTKTINKIVATNTTEASFNFLCFAPSCFGQPHKKEKMAHLLPPS